MNALDEHSKPYWTRISPVAAPFLDSSITIDVAIVGERFAGTSVAYELAEHGLKVAVFDRGSLGRGMTARTSAHLTFQSDDLYQEVISRRGLRIAKLHYQSQRASVDRIEAIQRKEGIACDFARLDGILGLAGETEAGVLDEELKACHQVGYKEVGLLSGGRLARLKTSRGLKFPRQARFHPLKYLDGLLRALKSRGTLLYAKTNIVQIDESLGSVELRTDQGHVIRAKAAVIATNSPIDLKMAIHNKQAPYRTYVLAAQVPKDSIADALYWDTEDPYHYVRLQPEEDRDILIVGGEDHPTGGANDAPLRYQRLEKWARARFPEMGRICTRWSGQILDPIDYTAFIGRSPDRNSIYLATGDFGQGLTHGTVAGMLLADLIVKKSNRWQEVYDPDRRTGNAVSQFIADNVNALMSLSEHATPGDLKSTRSCKRGQGGILRRGLEKLAVSRDLDGRLHTLSASCTHAGCIVRWNAFERCWDCPCHGSHFAPDGSVLNAPAVAPLKVAQKTGKRVISRGRSKRRR